MKKVLLTAIAAAVVISLTVTAFAAENNDSEKIKGKTESKIESRIDKLNNKVTVLEQKKDDIAEFRAAVKLKRDEIKNAKDINIALRKDNSLLRNELSAKLKEIKENDVVLSDEVIEKLKAYKVQIKEIVDALKETKGDIKTVLKDNAGFIKELNYEKLEQTFTAVAEIQNTRNNQLTQLNQLLKEMLAMVK